MELDKARAIVAKSERWNLDDKLTAAFDLPIGVIFWKLHQEGILDVSTNHHWWREMHEHTDLFDAEAVSQLLLEASTHTDMGGLLDRFDRSDLAWSIYAHLLLDAVESTPEPLIAGYQRAPEPLKTPWGIELVSRGLMDRSALPDDVIQRAARSVVTEVSQTWLKHLQPHFSAEELAPAFLEAASAEGCNLWTLDFLETAAPFATPEHWAKMALNIDYRETIPKMLDWLDRFPDGVEQALAVAIDSHQPQEQGVATAAAWAGPRALERGEELDGPWVAPMLAFANSGAPEVFAAGFAALPIEVRESNLLSRVGSYKTWPLVAVTPTLAVATEAAKRVASYSQSGLNDADGQQRKALAALATAHPQPFLDVLSEKKKPRARELLVEALEKGSDAGAAPVLETFLGDSKPVVRESALRGLVGRGARDTLERLAKSRKKLVREAAVEGLEQLDSGGPKADPEREREAVTYDESRTFHSEFWAFSEPEHVVPAADWLLESYGDRALTMMYWRVAERRWRIEFNHQVWLELLSREQDRDRQLTFAVAAVTLYTADFDSIAAYGNEVRPFVESAVDAGGAGVDRAWELLLRNPSWDPAARVHSAARGRGGRYRLRRALQVLGSAALPGIEAALGDGKAEVRTEAAAAIGLHRDPEHLPLLDRKDRSSAVRAALAESRFSLAALTLPPLEDEPDLDARLARFGGELPKGVLDSDVLVWRDGEKLSPEANRWVWARLGAGGSDDDLVYVMSRIQRAPDIWTRLMSEQKERWVILAGGWLATDEALEELGDGLDDEARSGGATWAFYKVTALARNGSPGCLRWLDLYGRKAKSQGLKDRARQALRRVAKARGLTADALADQVVGDLGVSGGERVFPYGEREVVVLVQPDGALRYRVGERELKSLPKALAADDAGAIKAHKAQITQFKSQLKSSMEAATERLEQAMIQGRRWSVQEMWTSWGSHPVLGMLAGRVWWAAFGPSVQPLTVGESGLEHPDGTSYTGSSPIGVLHPLELVAGQADDLPSLRSPFPQLGRRVVALEDDETGTGIARFEDLSVGSAKLRGHLERRRWTRGAPQDGGAVCWFSKYFPRARITAVVDLDPGFSVAGWDDDAQSLPRVWFLGGDRDHLPMGQKPHVLTDVDPIVVSEVLADLELL